MAELKRVKCGTPVEDIIAIMESDGGLILEDLLSQDQVDRLNAELDPFLDARKLGVTDTDDFQALFSGLHTKRITGLVTRSKVFREEILPHDQLLDYVDAFLHPQSESYWLSTAQVIEIQPGETAQYLHRDLENFPVFRDLGPAGPESTINCLIALTEFTEETGGTRVIPGSHKWPDYSDRGQPEMTVPVEMKPGSAFFYSGKVAHGGGANRSAAPRRALAMPYVLGWLAPEEAYPFYVPVELARTLPRRAQQLIGFRSFHNGSLNAGSLWQIDYEELANYLKMDAPDAG
jgi:ectoine hydroxylase-related dioxygenase (phytanoyl-CoA dioxygenase family)